MATIFVNLEATGSNNGTSWVNAYTNLQKAIANVQAGDEIWVAKGTYRPTNIVDSSISFILKDGVKMYGGFAGNETNIAQRNIAQNETILSGDIGTPNNNTDNTYHVVDVSNTSGNSVLDGFTITKGYANDYDNDNDSGGGILSLNSKATLSNLIISDNYAVNDGGGIYAENSDGQQLSNIVFVNNYAGDDGGAIYNYFSDLDLDNIVFNGNSAEWNGGAIYSYYSNPEITNSQFNGNLSNYDGGAIYNGYNSSPTITNVNFLSNGALSEGGAIYSSSNTLIVSEAIFKDNLANTSGGAIYNSSTSSESTIANSLFEGNISLEGGGVYNDNSDSTIVNSTFNNNQSRFGAAIRTEIYYTYTPKVENSIIWNNDSIVSGDSIDNLDNANTIINNSLVEGGYSGNNIFTKDPQFINPDAGDFRLKIGSPATNVGDNNAIAGYSQDIAGNSRIANGTVDLGAYEGLSNLATIPSLSNGQIICVDADAAENGNGTSWSSAYKDLQDAIASASFGSQIWVAEGTYKPTSLTGDDARDVSFNLKNGVAIYGGFAGNETQLEQRNIDSNRTILSGDIGTVNYKKDNSYHVVNASSTSSATILNGFTISDGNANYYSNNNDYGGGIYAYKSQAVFSNLVIQNNNAEDDGGGVYTSGGLNQFINVSFIGNTAEDDGGGLYNASNSILTNTTFKNNTAEYYGGAVYNYGSLMVENGAFLDNTAEYYGGAIYSSYSSSFNLTNTIFRSNSASSYGGAIYNYDTDENSTIANSIFDANTSSYGGAIYNDSSSAKSTNLTFVNNQAESGAAVYSSGDSNDKPIYYNSIFWDNEGVAGSTGTVNNAPIVNNGANTIVSHSIVEGGYNGYEIRDENPLFANLEQSDFRLQSSSPAINNGLKNSIIEDTDLVGNDRITGNKVDLGAYEYFPGQNLNSNPGTIGDGNIPISDGFYTNSNKDSLKLTTVHRFYKTDGGFHFYSSDTNEVKHIRQQSDAGNLSYDYETEKFTALASNRDITGKIMEEAKPVYRFFNNDTGAHLYTMDEVEKNYIQNNLPNYGFEDIKYYAFEVAPVNIETVPVYRMLNNDTGTHLLTADQNEINNITANLPNYVFEGNGGVAFHVFSL